MMNSGNKRTLISTGNETLDKFLGGGLLDSSLNLFERQGPSSRILDVIWHKSFAASTLTKKDAIVYLNFNTSTVIYEETFKSSLPSARKVKSDLIYKDVRGRSATSKLKIAWRYSERGMSSPSDSAPRMEEIDFGIPLMKDAELENIGPVRIFNYNDYQSLADFMTKVRQTISDLRQTDQRVNISVKDLLHPFSPFIDADSKLLKFLYSLRCLSRSLGKGAILISYDCDMCDNYSNIRQQLYNLADSVVSFYSYESGENGLTGYKDIDGTINYVKVPKINSFGFHFQLELSDWGYRLTKNHRFFVVDELSLPPCEDNDDVESKLQTATRWTNIDNIKRPLEQVGPLEEFREVAKDVLSKKL